MPIGWIRSLSEAVRRPKSYSLGLRFRTLADIRSEEHARRFFSILKQHNGPFLPTLWDKTGKRRPVTLSFSDLAEPIKQWQSQFALGMFRGNPDSPPMHWWICAYGDDLANSQSMMMPSIWLFIDAEELDASNGDLEKLERLACDLYVLTAPVHGCLEARTNHHTQGRPDLTYSLPGIYWINFFGRPYVDMFGLDKLETAPCEEVTRMPDGGFMLKLTATPYESVSKEGLLRAQAVEKHLGEEFFFHRSDGKNAAEWRERGRRKVPTFDWSKTPMKSFASGPVEPVVPDVEAFIASVPQLVDDLRRRIGRRGEDLDFTKKSLHSLDEWAVERWEETDSSEYWETRELSRELAAYLGEIIRRLSAAGEWEASKDEAGDAIPVVRYGPKQGQIFDPMVIVGEVLLEGLPGYAESEGGIYATGFSPTLFTWLVSHMPKEAMKGLFG